MQAQARQQGRYLGGRPPYGYQLVDAGPHPNVAHAAWGRRLHRLDPDPQTAPHVQWIFAQRLAGHSTAGIARTGIARTLNRLGVPPPSAHDRARNPHRSGGAWTLRTVAAILANPRYTGRQVWNRQGVDHSEGVAGDRRSGRRQQVRRWNPKQQWAISSRIAHPPLVSEEDFLKAQAVSAIPTPADGQLRSYLLVGLVVCSACGRRLDSHWVHNRPGYRCRHGRTSARPATPDGLKTVYWREDALLARVAPQLASACQSGDDPAALAAYLQANHVTIVVDADSISLIDERADAPVAPALTMAQRE